MQSKQVDKNKIVFLGHPAVGKTSILSNILYDAFSEEYKATIGVDFSSKTFHWDNNVVRLQMWDTAGQDRFQSLIPSYIQDSKVAVIVFDVTSRKSFEAVSNLVDLMIRQDEKKPIILVGNKIEAPGRIVSSEEAQEFAQNRGLSYHEVSAKTGAGVRELFDNRIVSLLTLAQNSRVSPKNFQSLKYDIEQLRRDYPDNHDVGAIVDILDKGLSSEDPQGYFVSEDVKLRAHLNKLAWTSRSILNTVLNVVIAVLQKVYAGSHALAHYLGLATQQTQAYPKFFTFGEKQRAQNLCDQIRATPR